MSGPDRSAAAMTGARRARRGLLRSCLLAGFLGAGLASLPTTDASAAGATFGRPAATSEWGSGITFEQPVVVTAAPRRVEIVISSAADTGAFVSEVALPATGSSTLRYTLDVATAAFLPNTSFRARWRVTFGDETIVLGPEASATYVDSRFAWRTTRGPIVRVHWYTGDEAFGRRALRIGEEAVEKAAALLGVSETDPIDFFVYADEASFYEALGPGTRENVGGQANAEIRTLFALITPDEIDDPWVGTVIPHELTHLVFDTAVRNRYHYPPRWLNEGLAVYLSQGYDPSDRAKVETAARDGELMPLDALLGQFPTTFDRFGLAYAESVSAVDFLVRTHSQDVLVGLVRSYADGRTDDEAFAAALGIGATAFGEAWLANLGATPPVRRGPQPAPAGPLPAEWTASSPGTDGATAAPGTGTPAVPATPGTGGADGSAAVTIGAVVILAVAGAATLLLRRRRRSAAPGPGLDEATPGDDAGGSAP